jgi:Protein of unknown function
LLITNCHRKRSYDHTPRVPSIGYFDMLFESIRAFCYASSDPAAMTDEFVPDPLLSPDQARVAASLSSEFIERIDAELLKHARRHGRKVAMLVGLAMRNPSVRVPGLPDLYFAQRIRLLVAKGELISEGNLDFMRYSEVRLP